MVKDLYFDVPLTLDFGIAVSPDDGEQRDAMIRLADTRLYEMKEAERHKADGTALELREPRRVTDALVASRAESVEGSHRERGETRGRDKRKWERVPMAGTSAHIVWNEGALTTSPVIDVSYGGVALLVENPDVFPTSLQAVLHMPIQLPVSVSLRKSYEQRIQGAGTRVGCVFVT